MRRSPLQRKTRLSPRRKRQRTIKAERQVDVAYLRRVRSLPCWVCESLGLAQDSPTDAHHPKRMPDGSRLGLGQKAPDWMAIPLCAGRHHWNGSQVTQSLEWFEENFENELVIVAATLKRLGVNPPLALFPNEPHSS